ncbi:MAG TPA: very short patch repair endonuclease [Candidatus Hydrogenedentes bacterium]|nr:very short patch repair endonuclease [Candidatus Hydrogenedentota bacterium]HPC15692.1 very short patch repair endonuclease [Candidatus Hydrogenedentota bacterium]HRT19684.1 very short patch repair endonuclease [Candidatus Hydrogenedentota bacterium]HRT64458.1 very short patch repair endonuclease [Candidatus Hydrogenedentota bacterium]
MDIWAKEKRSDIMSRIRSRGNKRTELRLIEILRQYKITGWKRSQNVFGKPDFVFWKERVAVFVDGCFWHRCPKCYRAPSTNQAFWNSKMARNVARDREVLNVLKRGRWVVLRIWEHQLVHAGRVAWRINHALHKGFKRLETGKKT